MQFVSKVYNAVVSTASQAFSVVGTKSKSAVSRLPSLTLKNVAISIVGLGTAAALLFILRLLRKNKPKAREIEIRSLVHSNRMPEESSELEETEDKKDEELSAAS